MRTDHVFESNYVVCPQFSMEDGQVAKQPNATVEYRY